MVYTEDFKIAKDELSRLQALLDIDDLTEVDEEKLDQLQGKQDDFIPLLSTTFKDGSVLTLDICSGSQNYYDNLVIQTAGGEYAPDCTFEVGGRTEVEVGDNTYVINWIEV